MVSKKTFLTAFLIACAVIFLVFLWHLYVPRSSHGSEVIYTLQKGMGYQDVARDLAGQGITKNPWFFNGYVLLSGNYSKLQAGSYSLSSSMSVVDIVKKLATGDVVKNTVTLIEGWDVQDIAQNLSEQGKFKKEDILTAAASHEGYIFPDTYNLSSDATAKDLVTTALANFDKKLTPELLQEITRQKTSIFKILIMASLLEKEVQTLEDKKIVAGILYKRLAISMPLQVDATINYVTGNRDSRTTKKDTTIDSPYNTYKYYGLPPGPICNPGMDSILAAIYPTKSAYWYYLSADGTGKTIFSKTLDEHNVAIRKYLK